ncbi:MAG TPA: general secretion pathway protein GspC [Sorangium sp.]|nr:general secretion pathway protein GspC [Sorangium sp.]
MNLDAAAKRFFPLILCLLIGVAAYFQATGMSELVASAVGDTPARAPHRVAIAAPTATTPSGDPVLRRNPFDSVTGPLDGRPPEIEQDDPEEEQPKSIDGSPSDDDPACDFGRVLLITAFDDPTRSFASVQGSNGESGLKRIGDELNGHKLDALSWERVWFVKDATRCQMKVGARNVKTKRKPTRSGRSKKPRRRSRGKVPEEISSKIHKMSDTEFNIERSVVDEILDKQAELMRYTRLRPVKSGDKTTGLKLSRIRNGTLLHTLGLHNGDEIQTINGFELTNPQKALEAYGRLRTADRLTLTLVRKGKPITIDFNIQ